MRKLLDWLSWWLLVPDGQVGWLAPAVWAGLRAARLGRPDVIYSTAPAWTGNLVGAALSRLLACPLVADFRDPWCGSDWRQLPYAAHRRWDQRLERYVVKRAAGITCAWDGIRAHLAQQYPRQGGRMRPLLNGFDPEQLWAVRPEPLDSGRCVLLHAGTFYGPRSPAPLLEALRWLRANAPAQAERLRVVLAGAGSFNGRPLQAVVDEHGGADLVRLVGPASHQQALAWLLGADVGLLFGQGGGQRLAPVPAKVYEYVGAGKAVLAIAAGREACAVLARGGCRVWNVGDSDPAQLGRALLEIIDAHQQGRLGSPHGSPPAALTRQKMSADLQDVLEEVIDEHRARRGGRAGAARKGGAPCR